MKIAIVGAGITGLACAHRLGPHHDVTLFEAARQLGGHASTCARSCASSATRARRSRPCVEAR
ncbi:MAG: FAD-dependent oxidoreductase [Deltaproteobacteria bacterium]|nr:FAD-dependent oxidoreductase [Deltaproteobacteria bacterium]